MWTLTERWTRMWKRGGQGRGKRGLHQHSNNDDDDETEPWTEIKDLGTDLPPLTCTFSEQPGPKMTLSANSSPLEFFSFVYG